VRITKDTVMTDLLHQKCKPLEGSAAMSAADIANHLSDAPGWSLSNGSIEKIFTFKNYFETIAFVNALAWICNSQDHHPDLAVSYSRCVVRFNTHSVGGISINDFICAAQVNELVALV
jgi:4a-hydroxytetrahydrobiopterin dehydratase